MNKSNGVSELLSSNWCVFGSVWQPATMLQCFSHGYLDSFVVSTILGDYSPMDKSKTRWLEIVFKFKFPTQVS